MGAGENPHSTVHAVCLLKLLRLEVKTREHTGVKGASGQPGFGRCLKTHFDENSAFGVFNNLL